MRILYSFLFVSILVSCTLTDELQVEIKNPLIGVVFDNYISSTFNENKEGFYYFLYADSAALVANTPFDSCLYNVHSFVVSSDQLQKGVWIRAKQFSFDLKTVYETNALFYRPVINKDTKLITLGNHEVLTVKQRSPKCIVYSIQVRNYYSDINNYRFYTDVDFITGRQFDLYLTLDKKQLTNKNDHVDELNPSFNFKTPFEVDFQGSNSLGFYDNNFGTIPDSLVDNVKLNFLLADRNIWNDVPCITSKYPVEYYFNSSFIHFVITCKIY